MVKMHETVVNTHVTLVIRHVTKKQKMASEDDELALTKSLVQRALLKPTMGEDDDREMRETGRQMMGGGGLGRV